MYKDRFKKAKSKFKQGYREGLEELLKGGRSETAKNIAHDFSTVFAWQDFFPGAYPVIPVMNRTRP